MGRRLRPIRVSARIRKLSDEQLNRERKEMAMTVGLSASRRYSALLEESIRREEGSDQ